MMQSYTDQQVLVAFNSCIDLEKYRALPEKIKDRLKELFRSHRPASNGQLDLNGSWLRCPAELYAKLDNLLIMNDTGTKYLYVYDHQDEDESYTEVPGDEGKNRFYLWNRNRSSATVITTREDADFLARAVNGIVVKGD